jgi:hypothetical protein
MTRAQLKQRIRVLGGHLFNGMADQDPFGLDLLLIDKSTGPHESLIASETIQQHQSQTLWLYMA